MYKEASGGQKSLYSEEYIKFRLEVVLKLQPNVETPFSIFANDSAHGQFILPIAPSACFFSTPTPFRQYRSALFSWLVL